MKNSLLKGLMVFLTMLCTSLTYSQDVSGTVSDASGPLPGASVLVKGTTKGAQTDFDGKFTIKNAGSNAVLVFSYIGLKSQEVNVAGRSNVNVTLKEDSAELKEVVVIGYGSVKKKDATGAVDQLSSKSFDNVGAPSPADLLRGKVSGVQVTSQSGEPGAGASIRIRGNSSIRSGNGPLIVVDGVPLDGGDVSAGGSDIGLGGSSARNPLNFINQNDIESMTILKDASSTAIYGSRGANGVVVITTKKSKSKEAQLTYSNSFTFSTLASNLKLMNSAQFVANGGANNGGTGYNWEDAILRDAFSTNHDVAFTKSTDNSSTRLSIGASNTEGVVKNTGLDKYTFAFNNSNDFFGGALKVDTKVNYSSLRDQSALISNSAGYIGNLIGTALYWNPTNKLYNANGTYNVVSNTYINPVQLANAYTDYANTNKLLASIKSTLKINENLNYQMLFGVETSTSTRKYQLDPTIDIQNVAQATPPGSSTPKFGQAGISGIEKFNKTFEHTLNYNKTFNENFIFDALAGYSYYQYNASGSDASAKGFDPKQKNLIDNIEGGLQNEFRSSSFKNQVELQSYFGRVNATLYKKLLVTATLRVDGSTKLGANNKNGSFPSVGLGYKVFEDKAGLVNSLKVRANYGITGNQEFAVNSAVARASYGNNGSLNVDTNANADLKWETTTSSGAGVDFALFNNRLTGTVDYFQRDTENLIFPVPSAATQPGPPSPRFVNLPGNLINKGFEVSANYKIIDSEKLTWDIAANASFLSNKMENFAGFIQAGALHGQGLSGAYAQVVTNNEPIYSYYMYEWRGYDSTGSSIYADAAGADATLGLAAKKLVGKTGLPKMNLGFSTNVTYKNFDAAVSFYGAFGHYLYNNTANAYFFKGAYLGGRNVPASVATSTQSQGDPNSPSTKFLEKGDFLRMGNLTLGYTFTGASLEKLKIKSARFFVNGQNLLLFTNYSGFDPEVNTDKSLNGVPSAGIDYLSYPRSKAFALGLNVTF
ncbi:SusC/RagA family TonB-linked outer membrane protein [Flavobacterium ammoniigenes]|jgi:TonB-linked SusC/RagA family outer membrane protein|uniref:SusC/RagA family TonB-linked outer membrane protein n=1 Tax=Flavobacterium ammoniigenes TaxID=1751095 RepID=A0ABN6KXH7_9FLAO|nr:SusC/RagA family TonB-linked outer membrane protein [Flavobacterium ammoniigenes]BDB53945.1 SusC/RagA family TonB-linked outer membrane protein [Flavobacterium ammoniigenes]